MIHLWRWQQQQQLRRGSVISSGSVLFGRGGPHSSCCCVDGGSAVGSSRNGTPAAHRRLLRRRIVVGSAQCTSSATSWSSAELNGNNFVQHPIVQPMGRRFPFSPSLLPRPPPRLSVNSGSVCRSFASASNSSSGATVRGGSGGEKEVFDNPYRQQGTRNLQLDFFGEPVTFLACAGPSMAAKVDDRVVSNAMAAYDGHLLSVVSKGRTCVGGGEEHGLDVKSMHAASLGWSELLRYAAAWNDADDVVRVVKPDGGRSASSGEGGESRSEEEEQRISAPMLAAVAVSPVLAHAGVAYLRHLDALLANNKIGAKNKSKKNSGRRAGVPTIQLYEIASSAVSYKDDERLNIRERLHLRALDCLLRDQHSTALVYLLRLLRQCPGDALGLSLAMDVAQAVGDRDSALRVSGTVSAYWNERRGGIVRPAMPGHAMASSLVALGLAVGGRFEEAEPLADRAMKQGRKVCGALATWSQAHIFDGGGRVAEGISALANFDGMTNYEGSGFLFFECRLAGYGSRFSLEREERGRGKSKALRLYDAHFGRILEYSGFGVGQPRTRPHQKAPLGWSETKSIDMGEEDERDKEEATSTFFGKWFGGGKDVPDKGDDQKQQEYEIIERGDRAPSREADAWEPSCEDILTWIPPTPQLLSDATLLLFRFTLNGTISRKDGRWDAIRKAWEAMLTIQRKHQGSIIFSPLISLAATLVCSPSETGADTIGNGRLAQGLYMLGEQLQLGDMPNESSATGAGGEPTTKAIREVVAEREPDFWLPAREEQTNNKWKEIVNHLTAALDGFDEEDDGAPNGGGTTITADSASRFRAWDFDARPIVEHAVVYAACKSGDIESLSLARSICSQGVTLRPNSPEEWWRYSIVLGLLGDDIASEDALNNSINVGAGQGARGS